MHLCEMNKFLFFFFAFTCIFGFSQKQKITIVAELFPQENRIHIQQKITYFNQSKDTLKNIYLHNWMNGYKNTKTPLTKRLLEDYDRSLYFAKENERGYSKIEKITNLKNANSLSYTQPVVDILKIDLSKSLLPNESISFSVTYQVIIPKDIFTKYGRNNGVFNLKYWYLIPAVYHKKWIRMSNLNTDDLFSIPTEYTLQFSVPKGYEIHSDLKEKNETKNEKTTYFLQGNNRLDIEINIAKKSLFDTYKTSNLKLVSNLPRKELDKKNATEIIERQLRFIQEYLGEYPHKKILLNNIAYKKNPVYGLNQLPKFLNPFPKNFEFDIKMFKILSKKYIDNTLISNKRKNYWLTDGIQTYLMMQYVKKFYPEIKAIGTISKIWGIRSYHISKIDFNEKYPFVYQFAMRKNLDQKLTTSADSLSTFNRKIVNKYKAGIGINYLDEYLKNNIVKKSLQELYSKNKLQIVDFKNFETILKSKTKKDLDWFFKEYLQTTKKADYTIKKVKTNKDSVFVTIKNKRNYTVPITLYGIKKDQIIFKKWLTKIDSIKTISLKKGNFDRVTLNYEYTFPELNLRNNWKNVKAKFFNRPLQFRFMKDIDNPNRNQVFYNIQYDYNYYDGLILGPKLSNKTLIRKRWIYTIIPTIGTTSKQITGSFSLRYQNYFNKDKKSNIFRSFVSGIAVNNFHYAPSLSYIRISPYANLEFKPKNYRDIGTKTLSSRYVLINRESLPNMADEEFNNYGVLNFRFLNAKIQAIKEINYLLDLQISNKFSKAAIDLRYRKINSKKREFNFRLYAATFITNKTSSDFFDFSLNRPSDYLFDYNFLGRSETSGFFSQEFKMAEGGFKSIFTNNRADQWMISTNESISLWHWIEVFGDAGFHKSISRDISFKYDSGIRLNFIHNFLEVYFPIQSSNGFEPSFPKYAEKIRFVLTLQPSVIYNYAKRGFY